MIMRAILGLAVAVCWFSGAAAQVGTIKTQSALDAEISAFFPDQTAGQITPLNTRQTLLDMVASSLVGASGLPIADPRNFSATTLVCSGGINASTAIAAAITAGYTRIRLPAGCYYQPPTSSGSEVVPAGIQIIGDTGDPNQALFSQVQTASRTTSTDFLELAKGASLANVAVQTYFCDQSTNPQATQKLCPLGYALNIGDQNEIVTNWAYQPYFLIDGTSTTQPGSIVSTDTPLFGITQNNAGDGLFLATASNGVSLRVQTQGNGDNGVLIQNGVVNPTNIHLGFHCAEYGTNSSSSCVNLERTNGATSPLLKFQDDGTGTATTDWAQYVVSYQSSGNIRNTFQTTTPFSGNFDLINAGNSGGTFTGNFALYQVNSSTVFQINSLGSVAMAGNIATSKPNTQTGSTYTVSTTDSSLIANAIGTMTLTLPAGASFPGRWLTVKTIAAQTVVSASSNVVPLAGGSAGTAILSNTAGKWADLQCCDGSNNWIIMKSN